MAHELHELSAAAHHTHNGKRPITERPPARCAHSPLRLTLTQTHTHARAANVELGQMTQMTEDFYLSSNSLSSAIPTGE